MSSFAPVNTFDIHSKEINDTFRVSVSLPNNYDNTSCNYSVVYLLDSNIFFDMVKGISHLLQYGNEIPQIILVGIGYPIDSMHLTLRDRDYLPTHNNMSEISGGADKFYDFLINHIKPYIENKYRVEKDNSVLAGDSYSGLFALYALFKSPNHFDKYIIGSPSIYWDNRVILDIEDKYAQSNSNLPAKVFFGVGQLEAVYEPSFARMVSNVEDIYKKLIEREYEGFSAQIQIFENETHLSVISSIISRGLRVVFESKKINCIQQRIIGAL